MHIPDGYLSPQTYVPLYGVSFVFWSVALKKLKKEISTKQVAVADRLVVTKTDLTDTKQPLIRRMRALNATAPILYADHGQIDPQHLFDGTLHDSLAKSFDVRSQLDT